MFPQIKLVSNVHIWSFILIASLSCLTPNNAHIEIAYVLMEPRYIKRIIGCHMQGFYSQGCLLLFHYEKESERCFWVIFGKLKGMNYFCPLFVVTNTLRCNTSFSLDKMWFYASLLYQHSIVKSMFCKVRENLVS